MKPILYLLTSVLLWTACSRGQDSPVERIIAPSVSDNGQYVSFTDSTMRNFFESAPIFDSSMTASYTAPGKIAATVVVSAAGASQNVVLFDNPDLAASYTALAQHQTNIHQIQQINIKQKEIELERASDLLSHGAATGRDVLEAQTALSLEKSNLANEKAALIQYEASLKQGGFDPTALRKAPVGKAYVICDIPENQINAIQEGASCELLFSAFPEKTFKGEVEDIADVIDNVTRMVKLRVSVLDHSSSLKAGMFAQVTFDLKSVGDRLTINKKSLVTVDGKDYVFINKGNGVFERKAIKTGQQIGDHLIVLEGLKKDDEVITKGAIQLKGLSFGY
ncbi:efflux RND transporter periplasmic adaptor subunit [Olivibacter sp. XZL3]|uniref:efflux RND transporter periplasmic adaptor subunit n=1 Tax=Olivibacter sp. XZL3 TaxID=1735116 RepID=UPI001065F630|nr:efflux RND transporter periplasmic adaptor subunit [Olivibacter sp. XZL3]